MNGIELRKNLKKFTDEKLLRVYTNLKQNDDDIELFCYVYDEMVRRTLL